jgi:hypothetical protein
MLLALEAGASFVATLSRCGAVSFLCDLTRFWFVLSFAWLAG